MGPGRLPREYLPYLLLADTGKNGSSEACRVLPWDYHIRLFQRKGLTYKVGHCVRACRRLTYYDQAKRLGVFSDKTPPSCGAPVS